jgi:Resolvase, N terminal domain
LGQIRLEPARLIAPRMSTEHRQYSSEKQADNIRQYAAKYDMDIVRVYSDHGQSGLNIAGRSGLNQLMADVENMIGLHRYGFEKHNLTTLPRMRPLIPVETPWGRTPRDTERILGKQIVAHF